MVGSYLFLHVVLDGVSFYRLRGIKLGGFSFTGEPLRLGLLRGNQFKLLLRGITADEQEVGPGGGGG